MQQLPLPVQNHFKKQEPIGLKRFTQRVHGLARQIAGQRLFLQDGADLFAFDRFAVGMGVERGLNHDCRRQTLRRRIHGNHGDSQHTVFRLIQNCRGATPDKRRQENQQKRRGAAPG